MAFKNFPNAIQKLNTTIKVVLITLCIQGMYSCALTHRMSHNLNHERNGIVGGYSNAVRLTASDRNMFNKAVRSIKDYTNIKPLTVATQVVSGTNYKFTCTAKDRMGRNVKGEIIIYKALPHTGKEPKVTKVQF